MNCPACHEQNFLKLFNRDQHSHETFLVQECVNCGLGVTQLPVGLVLGNYYPATYYGKKNKRFFGPIEWLISSFRHRRVRMVEALNHGQVGRCLDVGCGRGLMLSELAARGWDVFGTEFSEISSENARDLLGDRVAVTQSLSDLPDHIGKFDIITLWHVFEHLVDLDEALSTLNGLLKPGGQILIEVPNFSSLQAKIARSRWLYLEAPRHVYNFSPSSLQLLFRRYGFKLTTISTLSWEFGPFGMLQSLLNALGIEPCLLFACLKKRGPKSLNISPLRYFVGLGVSLVLTPLLLPIAFGLELMAVAGGRGSILRAIATR